VDVVRLGASIRALRHRRGWRQEDLAAAARSSRSAIGRLEQGRGDRVTVATLEQVFRALEARFVWRIDWRGEALDRLVDAGHAALVERVVALLTAWGWECATEVSFNFYGERGSVDVLAYHAMSRVVLIVEVKTAIGDSQATLMTLDRKTRLAPGIAKSRGWQAHHSGCLLVLPESTTSRRRLEALTSTYASALPDRGMVVRGWLRMPTPRELRGIWLLPHGHLAVTRRRCGQRVRMSRA
jgi:transcriptional regulator with XRE-family HTH domain